MGQLKQDVNTTLAEEEDKQNKTEEDKQNKTEEDKE